MRRIPFLREFDNLLRGNRPLWFKIGGGALVATLLAAYATARGDRELSLQMAAGLMLGTAAVGAFVGLLLALIDHVRQRQEASEPINPLLNVLFGNVAGLLLVTVFTGILIVVLIIVILETCGVV